MVLWATLKVVEPLHKAYVHPWLNMVKKGKAKATAPPPQASGTTSSKKPAKSGNKPPQEDDFIVFTNSTKDSKPRRGDEGSSSKGKAVDNEELPTGPPKPTVKQIIGGSSWTGKLPVNLLSEHCQRQKWDRPDYHPVSGVTRMIGCT
jgi:ATP-dependent RNA helicase DHX57